MRIHRVAALACAVILPLHAAAQNGGNVTVYGIVDHYVEYIDHIPNNPANPGAGHSSVWRQGSGGWNTSRFGLRGSEPLGGDLTALFNLENGFSGDTGAIIGQLFARQAWVGLSSKSWGTLQLGRTTTTINDMVLLHDPMRNAPRYSWLPSNGSDSTYSYSTRLDNMLKYTVDVGPVQAMAHYAAGEQAGATKPGSGWGAGAKWNAGKFSVESAYDLRNAVPNAQGLYARTRAVSLSGQYALGPATLTLGGIDYNQRPAAGAQKDSKLFWASVEYRVNTPLSVLAAFYREDIAGTSSDPNMAVLNATYALSKRTDVYVTGAYAWAKSDGARQTPVSIVRTGDAMPYYANQAGAIIGLRHRF